MLYRSNGREMTFLLWVFAENPRVITGLKSVKPLYEPIMAYVADEYVRHSASMS